MQSLAKDRSDNKHSIHVSSYYLRNTLGGGYYFLHFTNEEGGQERLSTHRAGARIAIQAQIQSSNPASASVGSPSLPNLM